MSIEEKNYISSFEVPTEDGDIVLYIEGADIVTEVTATPETLREVIENAKPNTIVYLDEGKYDYLLTLTNEEHNREDLSNRVTDAPKAVKFPDNLTIIGKTNTYLDANNNEVVEHLSTIDGISITSGLADYSNITYNNPALSVSSNLTIKDLALESGICLRNCVINGLNIIGCRINKGNILLSPDSVVDKFGYEVEPDEGKDTVWHFSSSKPFISNIFIENNYVDFTSNEKGRDKSGIYVQCVNNIEITNNTVHVAGHNGIQVGGQSKHYSTGKIAIINNLINYSGSHSINVYSLKEAELYVFLNSLQHANQAEEEEANDEYINVSDCTNTTYTWQCTPTSGPNMYAEPLSDPPISSYPISVGNGITIENDINTEWTDDKKAEIIQGVIEALPVYNGGLR